MLTHNHIPCIYTFDACISNSLCVKLLRQLTDYLLCTSTFTGIKLHTHIQGDEMLTFAFSSCSRQFSSSVCEANTA